MIWYVCLMRICEKIEKSILAWEEDFIQANVLELKRIGKVIRLAHRNKFHSDTIAFTDQHKHSVFVKREYFKFAQDPDRWHSGSKSFSESL